MHNMERVLSEINRVCGKDIWQVPQKALAAFRDIAPDMIKERKLLESFLSCGANELILCSTSESKEQQLVAYHKAKQAMLSTSFYSEDVVAGICSAFCESIGMTISESVSTVHVIPQSKSSSPQGNSTSPNSNVIPPKPKRLKWLQYIIAYFILLCAVFFAGSIYVVLQTGLPFDSSKDYLALNMTAYANEIIGNYEVASEIYAKSERIFKGGFASERLKICNEKITQNPVDEFVSYPNSTSVPTVRPTPTKHPTATPTVRPTATPTARPTAKPTAKPTARPTPTLSPWTHYPNWSLTDDYSTLRRGDSGDRVRKLQQALADLGYLEGSIDGKYGAKTEEAVAAFQRNNQIYGSTGIATTMTMAILYNEDVYSAYQTNPASYSNPGNHLAWNPDIGRYEDGRPGVCLWLYNDSDVPITAYVLGYYTETSGGKRVYGNHWYWYWDCEEIDDMVHETQLPISSLPNPDQVDKVYICVEEVYYADGRVYSSYGIPYERECFEYWID